MLQRSIIELILSFSQRREKYSKTPKKLYVQRALWQQNELRIDVDC